MNASPDSLPPYAALSFPVLFVTLWILVSLLISFLSGWHALARRFTRQSEPYGQINTVGPFFYSVYTRYWGHYSGVIKMTVAEDSLYLSVLFLFRVGHPPLRIPWSEIGLGTTTLLWRRYVVLTLGSEEQIPMRISERMARNLGILERISSEGLYLQTPR